MVSVSRDNKNSLKYYESLNLKDIKIPEEFLKKDHIFVESRFIKNKEVVLSKQIIFNPIDRYFIFDRHASYCAFFDFNNVDPLSVFKTKSLEYFKKKLISIFKKDDYYFMSDDVVYGWGEEFEEVDYHNNKEETKRIVQENERILDNIIDEFYNEIRNIKKEDVNCLFKENSGNTDIKSRIYSHFSYDMNLLYVKENDNGKTFTFYS